MGSFSVADAYLYTVSRWGPVCGRGHLGLSNLQAFKQAHGGTPWRAGCPKAEGLIK